VRFLVWCLDCRHRADPDPAEMAARYGAATTVPDWHHQSGVLTMREPAGRHGRYRRRALMTQQRAGSFVAVEITKEVSALPRRSGKQQRFCTPEHRAAFHADARRWAEAAVTAGLVSVRELQREPVARSSP
jgi:hypothetical protein